MLERGCGCLNPNPFLLEGGREVGDNLGWTTKSACLNRSPPSSSGVSIIRPTRLEKWLTFLSLHSAPHWGPHIGCLWTTPVEVPLLCFASCNLTLHIGKAFLPACSRHDDLCPVDYYPPFMEVVWGSWGNPTGPIRRQSTVPSWVLRRGWRAWKGQDSLCRTLGAEVHLWTKASFVLTGVSGKS